MNTIFVLNQISLLHLFIIHYQCGRPVRAKIFDGESTKKLEQNVNKYLSESALVAPGHSSERIDSRNTNPSFHYSEIILYREIRKAD